jgi:histidine triad (HIT) family protein
MPTLFSRIISREIPSYRIYEDEHTYAFLDIRPHVLGHLLIVAKVEIDHFADVPEPYYSAIFATAKRLSPALQKATGCARVAAMFAGYEVPHVHYHLIPTHDESDLDMSRAHAADPADLKMMQDKIISFL